MGCGSDIAGTESHLEICGLYGVRRHERCWSRVGEGAKAPTGVLKSRWREHVLRGRPRSGGCGHGLDRISHVRHVKEDHRPIACDLLARQAIEVARLDVRS